MANERIIPSEGTSDKVSHTIKIDGAEVPESVQVLSLVVGKAVNRIPYAKLVLVDGEPSQEDFPLSNEDLFTPGKEIEVLVGYRSEDSLLFKGIIVKHGLKFRSDAPSMLKLDCRDLAIKMTIGQKSRYFSEVTDSDILEEILGEYELSPAVEATDLSHQEMIQFDATDWDFVVSRAEANGLLVMMDDGAAKIAPPDFSSDPVLTLTYGANMLEFEGEMDARNQYNGVKGLSWDYTNQEVLEIEAAEPDWEEAGNIAAMDLAEVSAPETLDLRHGGQVVQDELQAWTDAVLLKSRLAKIQGRVKFTGFPDVKPGTLVELNGVGDRFNGKVFVSGVRHEVSGGQWNTDVQFGLKTEWFAKEQEIHSPAAAALLPAIQGLQIGIVTQLQDDPDGEERILVKLPMISPDEEGSWARVASLDAGDNRGTFFRPEIDDEVIVGFLNGDPRDPIVLGMVHSSAKPAPIAASDDNHEKGIISRSGMQILLNDEKNILNLETPAGKKVLLDEDQGVIQLEDENGNKIVMDSSGIIIESAADLILKAGANLEAEGSANLNLKAGANFKAEGSAGAEVSTSAVAVLKGSLVQIN